MDDSIRKCLDEADTVSELKLLLSASKDKTFVVVEGDDDCRLFKSLLGKNVDIVQSYQSKLGVEKMIKRHFPRQKRVIGIRDKDYQEKPICNRAINSERDFRKTQQKISNNIENSLQMIA